MAGDTASARLPRQIACARKGVYTNIPAGADPALSMTNYYQYLAAGVGTAEPHPDQIRWSTPYMDGGGLGLMVSVSMPVYTSFQDSSGRSHTLLAAVVGTDVLMSTLEEHANSNLVVSELISQSARCTISSLSDCELQQLRLSVQSQSCELAGTCAVCGADDLNGGGEEYPPLSATGNCRRSVEGVELSQRCGLRKSLKSALCQDINVNTLLPKGSEVKAYEFYICCDGCSRVELIVGVAVGSAVGVGVLGLLIRRLVLHARSKNNAKNMSKQKAGKAHSVEMAAVSATAPPAYNPTYAGPQPVGYA